MSPTTALFLLCSAFSSSTVLSALLGRPINVRLSSYNMNLVLKWDPPEGADSGLLYTAKYKSPVTKYRPGCVNISALECDFTSHHISTYGEYTGGVQALRGAESSTWVQSNPITLDKDTIIGPPSVSLVSKGATMEVGIEDPMLWISDVRSVYAGATYNITYWKSSQSEKQRSSHVVQRTRVILNDLDPWSQYCLQVNLQVKTARSSKTSMPSNITCDSTTAAGNGSPWTAAVLAFFGISVAVALVAAVVMKWKSISTFLFPNDTLPQCLKESVLAPPVSTLQSLKEQHPQEETCVQLLLISGDKSMEEETPQPEATSFMLHMSGERSIEEETGGWRWRQGHGGGDSNGDCGNTGSHTVRGTQTSQ